jgi:RNA polymerase sigma-70 factor (ECF subfamily)
MPIRLLYEASKKLGKGGGIGMREAEILDLFDRYSNMVYRIALSYLRQPQDAEDAAQSVFAKLVDGTAVPERGKERAFLARVAVNCCKDALRSAWRRRTEPLGENAENIAFEQSEDRELFDAVMALPAKYRIVVHLHYYERYTFSEIASFLKISPSAVSMRAHRAREALKNILGEDGHEIRLQTDI